MHNRQITNRDLVKQSNSTKKMKTILLFLLGIFLLNINNTILGQSNTKTKEQTIKQIQKADSIRICDISVAYKDTVTLKNTVEYHLNNGIIYIKEYYPNKKIKSESYWIDEIIPIYQIKQYKEDGSIKKIIDKPMGKYGLCAVLKRIRKNSILRNKEVNISISDDSEDHNKSWYVTYDHSNYRFGSSAEGIYYDCETGNATQGGYSISDQPANLDEPTTDQLPTYPGNIKSFEKYINENVVVPADSLVNSKVFVLYSVDPYGIVGNFRTQGATNYLNNEVLKIAKKMPNWIPAKDKTTTGACNVKGDDYGKYTFGFYVYFRRFD